MTQTRTLPWKTLWVSVLISVAVALARFIGQVQGWVDTSSGGGLHPLGVSWLPFVFGPVFARRLAKNGSTPRSHKTATLGVVGLAVIVATVIWQFAPLADAEADTGAVREATNTALRVAFAVTLAVAAIHTAVWSRLALTLICYAVPVRLAVLAMTAIAKQQDFDTHYTKFGPAGEQFDIVTTLQTAAIAQLGFWVPFAVICGFATGGFVRRRR